MTTRWLPADQVDTKESIFTWGLSRLLLVLFSPSWLLRVSTRGTLVAGMPAIILNQGTNVQVFLGDDITHYKHIFALPLVALSSIVFHHQVSNPAVLGPLPSGNLSNPVSLRRFQ